MSPLVGKQVETRWEPGENQVMNGVLVQIPVRAVPLGLGIFNSFPLPFPSFSVLLHPPLPALQMPFSLSLFHTQRK